MLPKQPSLLEKIILISAFAFVFAITLYIGFWILLGVSIFAIIASIFSKIFYRKRKQNNNNPQDITVDYKVIK